MVIDLALMQREPVKPRTGWTVQSTAVEPKSIELNSKGYYARKIDGWTIYEVPGVVVWNGNFTYSTSNNISYQIIIS